MLTEVSVDVFRCRMRQLVAKIPMPNTTTKIARHGDQSEAIQVSRTHAQQPNPSRQPTPLTATPAGLRTAPNDEIPCPPQQAHPDYPQKRPGFQSPALHTGKSNSGPSLP